MARRGAGIAEHGFDTIAAGPLFRQTLKWFDGLVWAIEQDRRSGEAIVDVGRRPQTPLVDPVEFLHEFVTGLHRARVASLDLRPQLVDSVFVQTHNAAMNGEREKGHGQSAGDPPHEPDPPGPFELEGLEPEISAANRVDDQDCGPACENAKRGGKQEGDLPVEASERKEADDAHGQGCKFLAPGEVVSAMPRGGGP